MRIALCTLVGVCAHAQAPQPNPQEQKAFLDRLERSLRAEGAPAEVSGFTARVMIKADVKTGAKQEAQGEAVALVDFLKPRYLKTTIEEGGETNIRGLGKGMPWMKKGKRNAYRLAGKEYTRDRKSVFRDLTIANAMTQILYPDRQMRKLAKLTGPFEEKVTLSRKAKNIPSYRITGIAMKGEFPLALSEKHRGPVHVTAWFRKDDLRPLVVRLLPWESVKSRKQAGPIEELRFHDHREHQKLLLPARIVFLGQREGGTRLRLIQTVKLLRFEANPAGLEPAAFAMPRS